jgi:glycosyltransferase involved in cell wall biosynthesis
LRRRLHGAEFVIACNERARDAVAKAVTCPVHVVRHGVCLSNVDVVGVVEKKIVAIGRLVPKKGFDTLLVAMAGLCHENAPCAIIGDGPERGRLEALATRLGVASRVSFLGRLPHDAAMAELSQAALLALPSRRTRDNDSDGFANVLAEAMARGVPVVTTTAAGGGELRADGESALLIPPDDPVSLAVAMGRLLAQPAFGKRLADNARRVLETRLDEEAEIAKTAELIFGKNASQK